MDAEPLPPPAPGTDAIRAVLARRVEACGRSPGMVVGLTDAGERRFVAYGRAGGGVPLDADTLFEIGSVTKLFTALLLGDMVVRGEVGLDTRVADLLPSGVTVPERSGVAITLAHLATHNSGLPRIPDDMDGTAAGDPYAGYSEERLYAFLSGHRLRRTPGEGYEYSNLGYGLLGHVLARHAGRPFEQVLRERITGPLGMESTSVGVPDGRTGRLATGYDDSFEPVPAWDLGVLAGAGGLHSSAADLLRFVAGWMETDGPLAAAVAVAMRKEDGLGLGLPQPEGHVAMQHGGGTGGFRSYAGCVPAWRRGSVVLANGWSGAVMDLGIHCVDPRWALHWLREPRPVAAAQLDRLVGTYRMRPGLLFHVTREGERLLVQLTGQSAVRVFPASDWHVFYKSVGAQITFEPGGDGGASRLVLHQNGVDQYAERVDIPAAPASVLEARVPLPSAAKAGISNGHA